MSRPVVVVTGGGAGIGAAIAEELGTRGAFVVTVDPMVTLDGSAPVDPPGDTTADRIIAAGGVAQASPISVTDADAVTALLEELVETHGRLDAVVNVAGISRPTGFARGTDDDWRRVLSVHLDGYLNVLAAALPIMAAAGRGRILGVTSGSGWRAADAGAYSCAKRAVASLTWQLGRAAPSGVTVNAISPIAVTRMVAAALGRAPSTASGGAGTGGLSLGSMPEPRDIGPFAAWLVGDALDWCSGEIFFAGGSEVAVLERPRLLEVVRTDGAADLAGLVDVTVPGALGTAEIAQAGGGGTNPRFGAAYAHAGAVAGHRRDGASCAVVSDRPAVAAAIAAAVGGRGMTCVTVDPTAASDALAADAVVVALAGRATDADADADAGADASWRRVLAEHRGVVDGIGADARWARAVAAEARPMRLVTITDATMSGGRSRAQAAAQLARSGRSATEGRVDAFAIAAEGRGADGIGTGVLAELTAHLVSAPDVADLSGAELVAGDGWFGLRSHPRPGASFTLGRPDVPPWLGAALREVLG